MFEYVINYKCKCNDKIHSITYGQTKEIQALNMTAISKIKCPDCNSVIKVQNKERWTIAKKKITKEII